MSISVNNWYFSPDHGQLCQVVESQTLWGETTCRVWLPGRDSVVRVPASRLTSLEDSGTGTADGIAYVASAARVADALTQDLSACGDAQAGVRTQTARTGQAGPGHRSEGSGDPMGRRNADSFWGNFSACPA